MLICMSIAPSQVKLNIPQLTLAKLAQLDRHESENTKSEYYSLRVTGSIQTEAKLFI